VNIWKAVDAVVTAYLGCGPNPLSRMPDLPLRIPLGVEENNASPVKGKFCIALLTMSHGTKWWSTQRCGYAYGRNTDYCGLFGAMRVAQWDRRVMRPRPY
jgi:hypothetical protein